jgi:hypothetical protein
LGEDEGEDLRPRFHPLSAPGLVLREPHNPLGSVGHRPVVLIQQLRVRKGAAELQMDRLNHGFIGLNRQTFPALFQVGHRSRFSRASFESGAMSTFRALSKVSIARQKSLPTAS